MSEGVGEGMQAVACLVHPFVSGCAAVTLRSPCMTPALHRITQANEQPQLDAQSQYIPEVVAEVTKGMGAKTRGCFGSDEGHKVTLWKVVDLWRTPRGLNAQHGGILLHRRAQRWDA